MTKRSPDNSDSDELSSEEKSRSQLKREAEALQDLGEKLIGLKDDQLAQISLPEDLRSAVAAARAINSRGAIRRQRQYIGKLMRRLDVTEIEAALATLQQKSQQENQRFHQLEKWRDRLIESGDDALEDFFARFPETDRNQLRQLVRHTRNAKDENEQRKHARNLFKFLRDALREP